MPALPIPFVKESGQITLLALALVLAAAFAHAFWNLLAKQVGAGSPAFVWLFGAISALIYTPLAVTVILFLRPHLGAVELLFMFGSGVLHLGYFVVLQRGYAVGDLSVVYPLARGTGPLLATTAAVVIFGERPGAVALLGIGLIAAGVFLLAREPGGFRGPGLGWGVIYGLLTGAFVAAYTIWDKQAVSALLSWSTTLVTTALLTPVAMRRREKVRTLWREHAAAAFGVAILSPLSYSGLRDR